MSAGPSSDKLVPGRVSVVMPVLDAGDFLIEAIESVLAQRYEQWELLIADDGSTDGSFDTARRYAARHPGRIRALPPVDGGRTGASRTRNRGIAAATGEYLALLDADDVWLPTKLAAQVGRLADHPEVALACNSTVWWYGWTGRPEDAERDTVVPIGPAGEQTVDGPKALTLILRHRLAMPCTCAVLTRTELAREVGGMVESFRRLYTDQSFFAKLLLRGGMLIADDPHDLYRQHADSACQSASEGAHAEARAAFLDWLETHMRENGFEHPALARAIRAERRWQERAPALRRLRRFYLKRVQAPGRNWADGADDPGVPPRGQPGSAS